MVYLPEVTDQSNRAEVLKSVRTGRWLSRGWSLQELIAPAARLFFDATWNVISGDKAILHGIQEATGLPQSVLQNSNEDVKFCAAQRMSWASKRKTTREEDMAYCLMGTSTCRRFAGREGRTRSDGCRLPSCRCPLTRLYLHGGDHRKRLDFWHLHRPTFAIHPESLYGDHDISFRTA